MAVENVPNIEWLDVFKILVSAVTPILALIGGIHLFFLKLASEREDVARRERRELYSRYLSVHHRLAKRFAERDLSDEMKSVFFEFMAVQMDLEVFATDEVYMAAEKYTEAFGGLMNTLHEGKLSRDLLPETSMEQKQLINGLMGSMNEPRLAVIQAMRADVLRGTGVKVRATDVFNPDLSIGSDKPNDG